MCRYTDWTLSNQSSRTPMSNALCVICTMHSTSQHKDYKHFGRSDLWISRSLCCRKPLDGVVHRSLLAFVGSRHGALQSPWRLLVRVEANVEKPNFVTYNSVRGVLSAKNTHTSFMDVILQTTTLDVLFRDAQEIKANQMALFVSLDSHSKKTFPNKPRILARDRLYAYLMYIEIKQKNTKRLYTFLTACRAKKRRERGWEPWTWSARHKHLC